MIKQYNLHLSGRRQRRFAGVLIACLLFAGATQAIAADWSFDPRVAVSGEYDDNNRLTDVPGQEIRVSGAALDAQLAMTGRTALTTFVLTPRLRSTKYPGDEQDEKDDQFLRMAVQHKGQRSEAALDADYIRIDTLGGYFPTSQGGGGGLGDPGPGTDVGGGNQRNREERFFFDPQVSFDITQRQTLTLDAWYLDVGYDRNEPGDRVGYSGIAASANYRIKTSETASLALDAGIDRYDPDDGNRTNSYAVQAEWAKRWSETAEAFVRGGANFVESDLPGGSAYNSGFSGGAGVRWKFQVTDLFLDANQYLDPNSSGKMVTRTQLRIEVGRELGLKTRLNLDARFIDDSGAPGDDTYVGKQYAAAGVGFTWRMTRSLSLFGRYQYRWKEQQDAANDAASNGVSVGVAWEPNRT
jgi:hypothetical protein